MVYAICYIKYNKSRQSLAGEIEYTSTDCSDRDASQYIWLMLMQRLEGQYIFLMFLFHA